MSLTADATRTVLFSTHISSDLERTWRRTHVAILHEGQIAYFAELDDLKDSVKRLRLSGSRDFPRDFSVPGALRLKVEGASALAAVPNVTPELWMNCGSLGCRRAGRRFEPRRNLRGAQ